MLFLTVYLQEGSKREEMEDAMQIFHYGNLSASTVLIQPVDDHDLEEMERLLPDASRLNSRGMDGAGMSEGNQSVRGSPRASETVRGSCCNFF